MNFTCHTLKFHNHLHAEYRAHSNDDHKLKGLSGSCIFAYEFYPIIGSSELDQAKRPEAQQTLSDIQRGTLSCKSLNTFFIDREF